MSHYLATLSDSGTGSVLFPKAKLRGDSREIRQ